MSGFVLTHADNDGGKFKVALGSVITNYLTK